MSSATAESMEATMFKIMKRTLVVIAMLAVVSAPSAAYARISPNPATGSAGTEVLSLGGPTSSSSQGFRWDDAGIGALGALVLLGAAGASSAVVRQRRGHA